MLKQINSLPISEPEIILAIEATAEPSQAIKMNKAKDMNQSLSKLSERMRNNSSNSSLNGSKIKLKFKPITGTMVKADTKPDRRDRNSRVGMKVSNT